MDTLLKHYCFAKVEKSTKGKSKFVILPWGRKICMSIQQQNSMFSTEFVIYSGIARGSRGLWAGYSIGIFSIDKVLGSFQSPEL